MYSKLFILSNDFEVRFVASYNSQLRDRFYCKFYFLNGSAIQNSTYRDRYGSLYLGSIPFLPNLKGISGRLRCLLELLRELTPSYTGNRTVENFQQRFINSTRESGALLKLIAFRLLFLLNRVRWVQRRLLKLERMLSTASGFSDDIMSSIRSFSEVIVGGVSGFRTPVRVAHYLLDEGIKVSAISISWDNISGYGLPGFKPAILYVWGPYNKKQAIKSYSLTDDKVLLTGACHLRSLPARRAARLGHLQGSGFSVSIFGKSPKRFCVHAEVLRDLAEIFYSESNEPISLRFRPHPLMFRKCESTGTYIFKEQIQAIERACSDVGIIYCPPRMDSAGNAYFDHSVTELLTQSDLALSFYSSVMIESALMGIPHISLTVDYRQSKKELKGLGYDTLFDREQEHIHDFASEVNSTQMTLTDLAQALKSPQDLLVEASRYNEKGLLTFLGFGND